METLSFTRYLLAKRSVDDRALNRLVWRALEERLVRLEGRPLVQVVEMGAGVGTMFQRMVEWGLLERAEYTLIDEMAENVASAKALLKTWAAKQGLDFTQQANGFALGGDASVYFLEFAAAEMDSFLDQNEGRRWDLLVANAFLDLVDTKAALPRLAQALRPGGLMYLTINFDGMTAFEPSLDRELDDRLIELYHRTMDERITAGKPAGESRTGRHLFARLQEAGLRILEVGGSDWVVYPREGAYPQDEAYFLRYILHFFEQSLSARPEISNQELARWLAARREQVESGKLVFIAHQFDFLVARE